MDDPKRLDDPTVHLDDPRTTLDDPQKRPSTRKATNDKVLDDVDDMDDGIQSFSNTTLNQTNRLAAWDESIGEIVEAAVQALNPNEDIGEIML